MIIMVYTRTFATTEEAELFQGLCTMKWPALLDAIGGARFRSFLNEKELNTHVVVWEFSDEKVQHKVEQVIQKVISKYSQQLSPKVMSVSGTVSFEHGQTEDVND